MNDALLQIRNVAKHFTLRKQRGRGKTRVRAVDDVSFDVMQGQSVGIAGESGSGKSTLVRLVLLLESADAGSIHFAGKTINTLAGEDLLDYRRQLQVVFQDSASALSPRMFIEDIIAEPLQIQQPEMARAERDRIIDSSLENVGLPRSLRRRYPHQLSGGQKQRVAIARAMSISPRMLVLDEPVSALDVSVRSQVLNLLMQLREEHQLTYLMIAHDLAILRHVTDYLLVMYAGRIVEQGPSEQVLFDPLHPYTRALVAAVPGSHASIDKSLVSERVEQAQRVEQGCAYRFRCPLAMDLCTSQSPGLRQGKEPQHLAACHALD